MVFKQDTNRTADVKTRRNDNKGKELLDRPTKSLDPKQIPIKLEVVDKIHFYL